MDGANQGTSFLDLPPEARNQIYELALIQERPIAVYLYTVRGDASENLTPREPGLLAVNRQIREESRGIFWSRNTFEATTMRGAAQLLEDLDEWKLARIPTLKIWNTQEVGLSTLCTNVNVLGRRFSEKGLRKGAVLLQMAPHTQRARRSQKQWERLLEIEEFEIAEQGESWCVGLKGKHATMGDG